MKWAIIVACLALTEVSLVMSGGPNIVTEDSCTTEMMVSGKQCVIKCIRSGRNDEASNNNTADSMLTTSDCISHCFSPKGSNPNPVTTLRSSDLLDLSRCNNHCYRIMLTVPDAQCKYQTYLTCFTNCLMAEITQAGAIKKRRRRKTVVPSRFQNAVYSRVKYLGCFLNCVTPDKVLQREVPIPTNAGCSVRDLVKSTSCRNKCLYHTRAKRSVFENAAAGVPALLNLINSHCLSVCLNAPYVPNTATCDLIDAEQFEFCTNKCILDKTLTLPGPP